MAGLAPGQGFELASDIDINVGNHSGLGGAGVFGKGKTLSSAYADHGGWCQISHREAVTDPSVYRAGASSDNAYAEPVNGLDIPAATCDGIEQLCH